MYLFFWEFIRFGLRIVCKFCPDLLCRYYAAMKYIHCQWSCILFLILFVTPCHLVIAQQPEHDATETSSVIVDNVDESQIIEYQFGFFSRYRPETALDMVRQVPGFDLDDGGDSRGFASAAGNILINGSRTSSKEDQPSAILGRIPASRVDRIELIRGQVEGVDLRGQTVVVNVILREEIPATVRWETAVRKHFDVDRLFMTGDVSVSDSWRNIDYNLGFFIERNANGEKGVEDILDSTNRLIEKRNDNILETGHEGIGNLNASSWLGNTLVQFNAELGILNGDGNEYSRRFPQPAGSNTSRRVTITDETDNLQYEIGIDAEQKLSDQVDVKIIFIYFRQDEDVNTSQVRETFTDDVISIRLAESGTITEEAIARLELDYTGLPGHALQVNLEGAYNAVDGSLDQTLDTGSGPVVVDVPGANTRVEEVRFDIIIQDTWSPGNIELDYGLSAELSKLSQSGDTEQERDFHFIKPHLVMTYSSDRDVQTQLRVARQVSQLDFNDFISATVFEDDDLALGNPDLRPEATWVAEASHERRYGDLGVFKVSLFHHWIDNVLDLLPITDEFEAPGNIGNGRRWGAELASTVPLDWLHISGGRLDISARWQDSTVIDPVTEQGRVLSGNKGFSGFSRTSNNAFRDDNEYSLIFDFRQDFEEARAAWGWVVRARSERTLFNVNELDVYDEGIEVDAFIETTRWFGTRMALIGENLTNARQARDRIVYFGERDLTPVDFTELEVDRDGVRIILQLSGNF